MRTVMYLVLSNWMKSTCLGEERFNKAEKRAFKLSVKAA
jgi:hypothetical protein